MTAVENIILGLAFLPSSSACDMLIDSLVANQAKNRSLRSISLYATGADSRKDRTDEGYQKNVNFSDTAKAQIATLEAKGITVYQWKLLSERAYKNPSPYQEPQL